MPPKTSTKKTDSASVTDHKMAAEEQESRSDNTERYKCSDFKDLGKCFALLRSDINNDMAWIKNEVKEVKQEVTELKKSVEWNTDSVDKMYVTLEQQGKDNLARDVYSRKWNLILRGIEGDVKETPKETSITRNFMVNTLKLERREVDGMLFAAAHRLHSGKEGRKNIIVKFVNIHDRDICLEKAFKMPRGTGLGVSVDFPRAVAMERDRLLNKSASETGSCGYTWQIKSIN